MNASNAAHAQILARLVQLQKATANTLLIPINASIAEHVRTVAPSAQLPKSNKTKTKKSHTRKGRAIFFVFVVILRRWRSDICAKRK